jgi:hypothetical protein
MSPISVIKMDFYPGLFVQSRAKPSPVAVGRLQRDDQPPKRSTSGRFGLGICCLGLVRMPRGSNKDVGVKGKVYVWCFELHTNRFSYLRFNEAMLTDLGMRSISI